MNNVEKFRPSRNSTPFAPSANYDIPANASLSQIFRGYGGKEFGFNRINIGTSNYNSLVCKAILNNEQILFEGVHLSSLRNMFLRRSLLAPFVIQENNFLELIITNLDTVNGAKVTVQLLGFDHIGLREWNEYNERNGRKMPEPVFLYGSDLVNALQDRKRIRIQEKSRDVIFSRMFAGSTLPNDAKISLDINNDTIKKDVYLNQLNDEYESMQSLIPYYLGKRTPFDMLATNLNNSTAMRVSFLAEAYYVQG